MGRQQRGTTQGWVSGRRVAAVAAVVALVFAASSTLAGSDAIPGASQELERRPLLPTGGSSSAAAEGGGGSIVDTVISLAIVLGLIFGCAAAFRKLSGARGPLAAALGRAGRSPSGLLEILARYPLGRGQTLVLLRLDRRVLLLSQSVTGRLGCSASFTVLCEVTDPEDVASILGKAQDEEGDSMAARFRSLLGRFDEPGDELEEEPWLPRRSLAGEGSDRAELLAETDPDLPEDLGSAIPLRRTPVDRAANGPEVVGAIDAVGSLRRRLESLRMAEGG